MIELKDINFTYENANEGLSDINISIKKGEVVLFCGQSGCGKTSITRLINGLIPNFYEGKLEGSVSLNAKNVSSSKLYEVAKDVGSVFQNPRSQFFNVDTNSELSFALENQGRDVDFIKKKVGDIVKEYNIEKLMNRSMFELSGGEKQKIACASVATSDPSILVLDEPSSNLDTDSIEHLRELIIKWKSQGKIVIIAEHRLYYISDMIDKAIYMNKGKIEHCWSSEQFLKLSSQQLQQYGLRRLQRGHTYNEKDVKTPQEETITFSNFSFSYNKRNIFNIDKLNIVKHKINVIVGTNGLGKTTLLRCMCGLEKKCKGLMLMDGKLYKNKQRLKHMFMVMQDVNHQLFSESVYDEVAISMDEEKKEKIQDILTSLNLWEYREQHPMALSGGQKQRLAIATAIASDKEILLFDEPTSGLDYLHMMQVSNILKQLKNYNKTIVVVTHDEELIESCADYTIHLSSYL